jgi:RNA polymerase sigma-70 factor (ECF subfamily)
MKNYQPSLNRRLTEEDFKNLFLKEFANLKNYAHSIVKENETSSDIVQEAFLALWENREKFENERNPKPYLITIIRNKSINYLRNHKKYHPDLEAIEDWEQHLTVQSTDQYTQKQLKAKIQETLDHLPPKCREIFMMNRQKGLKYKDIASTLGISVKTVEAQMAKALKAFHDNLGEFIMLLLAFLMKIFF